MPAMVLPGCPTCSSGWLVVFMVVGLSFSSAYTTLPRGGAVLRLAGRHAGATGCFSRRAVVSFKRKRTTRDYEVSEDWYAESSKDEKYDPFSQFLEDDSSEDQSTAALAEDSAATAVDADQLDMLAQYQKLNSELGAMVTDVGGDTWGQKYPDPTAVATLPEEDVPIALPRNSNDTMPGNGTDYWNVLESDMDFSSDLEDDDEEVADRELGNAVISDTDDFDVLFQETQRREEVELDDAVTYLYSPSLEEALSEPGSVVTNPTDPTCDRVFVSAVTTRLARHVQDILLRVGVDLTFNADDYQDAEQAKELTIEQLALLKARELHRKTGLPAIAERSGWSIEASNIGGGGRGRTSAYEFNVINDEVDKLIAQLSMFGDDDRITTYSTAVCYVDGEREFVERAEIDVSLLFAEPNKQLVSASYAVGSLVRRLTDLYALSPLRIDQVVGVGAIDAPTRYTGSRDLKEAVLKHGKVLPNNILDVSAFMDSMVNVDLMYACAQELAGRFMKLRPSKILTVATTGLVLAIPMAQILQVPVVYARKQRSVVMSDSYIASYSSKNHGSNRELHVSKEHIDEDDRVLLVDDFLSSGSAQEALMRVVGMADATPIGVAVLLEKVWESGRIQLSGFDVQVESLVPIQDVDNGQINIS